MKYITQFLIILAFSFAGEALHAMLPLPIPASIYGIVMLFVALHMKWVKVKDVREVSTFLIAVMPVMFIPAAVGLVDSWADIAGHLVAYAAVTVLTTFVVMGVAGLGYAADDTPRKGGSLMERLFCDSVYFGVCISLVSYAVGVVLRRKTGWGFMNPLLVSIVLVIAALLVLGVDYGSYSRGAAWLSYLLTPATVCLAVPLYQQVELLKKNYRAIVCGIAAGALASLVTVLLLALAFGFGHEAYVTFLPKSITTAIGMGVSEELGGIVSVTVVSIIVTGVLGNIFAEKFLKLLRIEEPIAKGIAIGSSSHAIGTAKAMEMGVVEGATSGLSIVVSGILTVIGASVFALFL